VLTGIGRGSRQSWWLEGGVESLPTEMEAVDMIAKNQAMPKGV